MMDIGFFFNSDDMVVQLPVNPEKIEVSFSGNNKTFEIVELGEINLLKDRKLATISFNSFFPYESWFPAVRTAGKFESTAFYKQFFEGLMNEKKSCQFIVTGLDINMLVSVEKFEFYHQAGDHEDAYYSLSLKEYKEYEIVEIPIDPTLGAQPSGDVPPRSAGEITVGSTVILNGRVHYDSYGSKPGMTFTNYKGKISHINRKGSHPYHVTTMSGGWLGWVTAGSVTLA